MPNDATASRIGTTGGSGSRPARRFGRAIAVAAFAVFLAAGHGSAQDRNLPAGTIKGAVTTLDGVPIPFVNVIVLETNHGAMTDSEGRYEIKDVPPGEYTIQVSCLGYHTIKSPIKLGARQAVLLDARLRRLALQGNGRESKPMNRDAVEAYDKAGRALESVPFAYFDGGMRFALDLYRALAAQDTGNLVASPHSAASALAMAYAGARSVTATEMGRALRVELVPQEWHPAFGKLNTFMQALGNLGAVTLESANSVWMQDGFSLEESYLNLTETFYGAGPSRVDFMGDPGAAAKQINDWVAGRTHDRIPRLLGPESIDALTRLILVNAVYFLGDWREPFNKERTRDDTFHAAGGELSVPFMQQTERFAFGETKDAQVLELPYREDLLSMIVVLPKKRGRLADLERGLSAESLRGYLRVLSHTEVHVALPKFTLRWRDSLVPALMSLGMPTAFTGEADFSGISTAAPLLIDDVIQEAFIQVDETGTEAAAATAVTMRVTSMRAPEPPPSFIADHPFLFFIRDNATGTILFLGRVADPS